MCILKSPAWEDAKSHLLHLFVFSPLCVFLMFPQISCLRRGIVTLIAFVWLFSTVNFHMCPQISWVRRGVVTLVAFVWLFSTVRFQMCLQIACQKRGIVVLIAFVWFSLFIICVSQGNTNIDPTFTKVIICKILIHHQQSRIVVPCVLTVVSAVHEMNSPTILKVSRINFASNSAP